ncbi:hypothetical protein M670_00432 [Schinkia azotoformans MEV2011]|uniref:Uncharacterized protein n=1 Tax=Schinkia azotoformans MEV2011 TaxID=1348973 RepID=A0A072NSE1_SCHAZ|nr:hypothetical protein [Schinkia azotoformans]KEF40406.1 hypothetical protein M670_00432 [Schinkia azotoformans MEV2011]MEC1696183.1 hypothetical protein [Schinkia azotoformans]MEC1725314.1 hypothetical protein [Schinkia azotoformans]MEC1779425.1 hypothetical protein [Schinkia azotoformans]MED4330090.1 hypothetical protein [Schinkia azotoformans]
MKKIFKIGCFGFIGLVVLSTAIGVMSSINSENSSIKTSNVTTEKTEIIIDANQFSRISSDELINIMGQPQKIDEYMWLVPSTGKKIPGKTYIYEDNKYEFMVLDDTVTRLSVYSGTYMGYDESIMEFKNEEDLFSMFNIKPNDHVKKVGDTGYALRFSPVSDKVADLWIVEVEDNKFGAAKITYNLNYY